MDFSSMLGRKQPEHLHSQGDNGSDLMPNDMITLTDEGKNQLYRQESGGWNLKICSELEAAGGSCAALRLAQKTGIPYEELKRRIPQLQAAGVIRCRGQQER